MKISSGSKVIDELLEGGFEDNIVTTVYGPSASGKTNICLIAATSVAAHKKVIYIDTEGGASPERIMQLSNKKAADNIFFLKPTSFQEQVDIFNKLKDIISEKIGLVVVDTIAMLYRSELGRKDVYEINKILGRQLSYLVEIARKMNIPVLIANQVYSNFNEKDKHIQVGGDIITYSSKCLIELKNHKKMKEAVLVKHRSLPKRNIFFSIINSGLRKEKKNLLGVI